VLVSLLGKAYAGEFAISEEIAECLLYTNDDECWNSLFVMMHDCEVHRIMIEDIVKSLGFDIENFREYSFKTVNIRRYEAEGEKDVSKLLSEIHRWVEGIRRYYAHLLNFDFSEVAKKVRDEAIIKLKDTLKQLMEMKEKHVKTIKKLLSDKNFE